MLVSGGKVIAIDSIKKGNTNKDTLSGDGVWTNLGVNTDVIATTKKLNDTKSELESKINSASSALSGEIKKKQDELKFELNDYNKITAIGPKNGSTTALAGGSNVVVSAGANTRVDSAASGEQTIYTVNVTANPTNVTVSGENGLTARREEGTSAYYLGLNSNYIKAITSVSSKLDQSRFDSYTATADVTPYTKANNYINITNHKISGYDWTNTITAASAKAVTTVDNKFEGNTSYSGYNGKPFIDNTTPKWSVVGDGNRISVTSANNKYGVSWNGEGIATEQWVRELDYLPRTEAAETYQPIGDYVVSSTDIIKPGSAWVLVNDNDNVQWSGLDVSELGKKYIVKSTNGTIGVGSATVGNVVTYDLSGATIVGENGISAGLNPATNEWNVGLEDYNDIGFAKYSSSANVYTASAVVDGYTEDLNVNPTKITLNNDQILLKTGFYHVDVQTNFTIANPDNNYYNVFVKSIPNAASITQMIDGSYSHTETVDLSFDIRITNDNTPLEISVENFKTNEIFAISNLNIHEIVSMPSQIEGGAGNYQAGNGITITNDTIQAKLGNGLEFNESNAIQVKLGSGLKFDETQGVQAITIDSDVSDVVDTVQELQESLDTKITDNYPPAMITIADLQVANQTQYAPSNGGMLIGYLFTCPITHKIYVGSNNDYKTKIGIYTKQWSGDNKKVILGIYEYQPDYVNPDTQQVGKTEALCDTGIIELQQGYAEYDVKNLGTKTTHEMKPGCFYYATIYLSYKAGDTNGITLFGAPGYNTQVNNLKPGITITNVNCIHASLYEGLDGYSPDLNFDQMGFSWQYDSYPPSSTSDPYTSQGIVEAHAAGRPYFAIRNVKIVAGN